MRINKLFSFKYFFYIYNYFYKENCIALNFFLNKNYNLKKKVKKYL